MTQFASTRMSSKGQIVIPEEIRKTLNLQEGSQFVVFYDKDVLILKIITPPSKEEFDVLVKQARKVARRAGLSKNDVKSAIVKARKK